MNGIHARNYDMPLAFPHIKFNIATKEEIQYYKEHYDKTHYSANPNYPCKYKPPAFFGPYYNYPAYLEFRDLLIQNFEPVDKYCIKDLIKEVLESNSCAVHVRRGDVSGFSIYGYPPDEKYFLSAIDLINNLDSNVTFYFFSDEPLWVEERILPHLSNVKYKICKQNGSDKGYLDLYAISRCKHIISSHGSLGVYGKFLSIRKDSKNFFIISKFRKECFKMYKDCILISNNSIYAKPPESKRTNIKLINKIRLKVYNYLKNKLDSKGLLS